MIRIGEAKSATGTIYPVLGKVVLADGEPFTSGRISFVSDQTASVSIGEDGTFEVKHDSQVGATEGTFILRVEMDETNLPKAKLMSTARFRHAGRYNEEDASKQTAVVNPDGGNTLDFKLARK